MIPNYNHKTKIINSKEYIFDEIRKKWILTTPEEIVRQNCWKFLHFEKKNYPLGLIAIEKEIKINQTKKRFDIVIYDNTGAPNILIECKSPEVEINDETLQQILTYQRKINAKLLILTNGTYTYCIEIDLKRSIASYLKEILQLNFFVVFNIRFLRAH